MPTPIIDPDRLRRALSTVRGALLAERNARGHWTGELSTSALSTATAVTALASIEQNGGPAHPRLVERGLDWLAQHRNADGGWGDTTKSHSNISTTALCWAAFGAVPAAEEKFRAVVRDAEAWLTVHSGGNTGATLDRDALARAIIARYGKDRTFSVPILTMCALAGRFGAGRDAWRHVLALPYELATLPPEWFAAVKLPVVSYALPALIAIGQARQFHRPTRNPITWLLREGTRARALRVLGKIQPPNGGFLEATPLTSFVTMSLAGSGQAGHPVARKGVEFLVASARPDGGWAIDTNLATWVTTLSVNALAESGPMTEHEAAPVRDWLLSQQYRERHPYTNAAPGGWAWTDLPGGVPDADDTAGALLALKHLRNEDPQLREAAVAGVAWLFDLQNGDGGIPTFCRGWGHLPFDRSSPDLTAHALRAWAAWGDDLPAKLQRRVQTARARAMRYLATQHGPQGEWIPLWFGNQHVAGDINPLYGTARVLHAMTAGDALENGVRLADAERWLIAAQNGDAGWGGGVGIASSVEETALAVEALAGCLIKERRSEAQAQALARGVDWLVERVENGAWREPSPIGFYFAKLWYFERLYPLIFTVGALGRAANLIAR
jgi:squalene-hopene/tetraprenyl-beta-curcumene cyclase